MTETKKWRQSCIGGVKAPRAGMAQPLFLPAHGGPTGYNLPIVAALLLNEFLAAFSVLGGIEACSRCTLALRKESQRAKECDHGLPHDIHASSRDMCQETRKTSPDKKCSGSGRSAFFAQMQEKQRVSLSNTSAAVLRQTSLISPRAYRHCTHPLQAGAHVPENPRGSFTEGQTWGALKKSWRGYRIAKAQGDRAKMEEYAKKIRTLQEELGIKQAAFPELGLQ
jgi:hypothetical protein